MLFYAVMIEMEVDICVFKKKSISQIFQHIELYFVSKSIFP